MNQGKPKQMSTLRTARYIIVGDRDMTPIKSLDYLLSMFGQKIIMAGIPKIKTAIL